MRHIYILEWLWFFSLLSEDRGHGKLKVGPPGVHTFSTCSRCYSRQHASVGPSFRYWLCRLLLGRGSVIPPRPMPWRLVC